ncbi:MAG: ABC transporter ATP-binding protein/permease, partial [Kiritimatiellaeota bacterium]|nr:ABC transporter ATP-binding protein/permease [Kiritimatiellota bacterium]
MSDDTQHQAGGWWRRRMTRRPRRYERRDVPSRPPRQQYENREEGPASLIMEFMRRYMMPRFWMVCLCILLYTLQTCSTYLMAYYGRVVVDDILVITDKGAGGTQNSEHRIQNSELRTQNVESQTDSEFSVLGSTFFVREGVAALTDEAVNPYARPAPVRPPHAGQRLFRLFVIYLVTLIVLNAFMRLHARARIRVASHIVTTLRADIHRKIIALSSRYHQGVTPGRLMARILSDSNFVQHNLLDTVVVIVGQVIMFLVGFVILVRLDWITAVAVIVAGIPYSYSIKYSRKRLQEVGREARHTNSCLWGLISQKIDAVKAIFAYGREKSELLNFFRLSSVMQRDVLQQQRLGATIGASASLISSLTTQAIFVYCTLMVINTRMTLGEMMFIYSAASSLFGPIVTLTQLSTSIVELLVILQRITTTLRNDDMITESPDAIPFPQPLKNALNVNRLSFRYAEASPNVLSDITLAVPTGSWVCIMGPSGSGKTTLINLLSRLYEPTEGNITVDDIPLGNVSFMSLRKKLTVVPQEAQIISGTIRDNITYGSPVALPGNIMEAARAADCHAFIMDLPVKYETIVGDKGVTLSGGQRQRISIARALLTRPEILILDDCTSALDANTERKI